jgi:hypothetical protein
MPLQEIEMDDFIFSLELVKAMVLEDFKQYFPEGYKKTKPMVHWGVEYEIKFMDQDIPEEPGMLSRRFMEITLRADEEPVPATIAREIIMRGGRCVSAAALKARERWWNGKKSEPQKKGPSVQEALELMHKTGRNPLEKEVQEALPGLDLIRTGTAVNPRRSRAKRRSH